jgi:predicted restriction endonuclease
MRIGRAVRLKMWAQEQIRQLLNRQQKELPRYERHQGSREKLRRLKQQMRQNGGRS